MLKKPVLLFISHDASPTGAPTLLLNLLKWLRLNASFEIRILLRQGGALENAFRQVGTTHVLDEFHNDPGWLLYAYRDVDLIYSNTVTNGQMLEMLSPLGCPVISHIHEMDFSIRFFGKSNFEKVKTHTNVWIAASRVVRDTLIDTYHIARSDIHLVHEFLSVADIQDAHREVETEDIRSELGLDDNTKVVIGCGTLDWRKGPDLFIQVAKHVVQRPDPVDVRFVWIGSYHDKHYYQKLLYEIESLGLGDRVHLLDFQENLWGYFSIGSLFLLTSREDPFPLVVLMAALKRIPTICFENATGSSDLIAHRAGFIVPFMDTIQMAGRTRELLDDTKLLAEMGQNAHRQVIRNYTVNTCGTRILRLIYRCLQEHPLGEGSDDPFWEHYAPFKGKITHLEEKITQLGNQIDYLKHEIREKERIIIDKERYIEDVERRVRDTDRHAQDVENDCEKQIGDKERYIQDIRRQYAERENYIQSPYWTIHEKDKLIRHKDKELVLKTDVIRHRNKWIEAFKMDLEAKETHIKNLDANIEAMKNSTALKMATFVHQNLLGRSKRGEDVRTDDDSPVLPTNLPPDAAADDTDSQAESETSEALVSAKEMDDPYAEEHLTPYDRWLRGQQLDAQRRNRIREEIDKLAFKPTISIVMPVFNVDQIWLERAIASVQDQLYPHWELCIADDASPKPHVRSVLETYDKVDERIKVAFLKTNHGIAMASNEGAKLVTGEYVGLLDHDDELSPDALYEVVKVLNREPKAGLIYSDEDKLDMAGNRIEPFFKPDFSPDLILSQNYICHFSVIKKSIFDAIGGFREGFEGSQDHDLVLRAIPKAEAVVHIPKILYHWRKIPGSTAAVYDSKSHAWEAGRRAIRSYLDDNGIAGHVFLGKYQGSYRVKRKIDGTPKVSVIIPFRDHPDLLKRCLDSILERSTYQNYEILGISNNSENSETLELMDFYAGLDERVRFEHYDVPFNYSKINNYAVGLTTADHLVLLNNDIEIISPDWIESLLEHSQRSEVGAVGAKLYYPDWTIQHAGIIVGIYGNAGVSHKIVHKDEVGYYARPHVLHNVSAVTAACLMVKKDLYEEIGGLNEDDLGVAYNDVDFCLRLREKGYLNVFTPYCEAIHFESKSRGYETTPDRIARFKKEMAYFEKRWRMEIDNGDPFYNPNLTLNGEDYAIRLTPENV